MLYRNIEDILCNNQRWAACQKQRNPNCFRNPAIDQHPPYLYIGCSDSQLPLTQFM